MGSPRWPSSTSKIAELDRDADPARQVERLEAKLEQLYAVAVTVARREEDLEQVEAIWARMVVICDAFARAVSNLRKRHPSVGLACHDRILDIRNECEENRALHA